MGYSEPRQNFGSTSPLFSRYTSRRGERVSGEQHGGEAETLSRIRADYGTNLVYASTGCPKKVDNPKTIRLYICKDRILPTVSVSDGRRLTGSRDLRPHVTEIGVIP